MYDVISRRAAIEAVSYCGPITVREAREELMALPAIDVAPIVHAYWKKTYDLIDGHDGYECSACGYIKYFDHYDENIRLCKPYCCECGARMDGGANG